MEYRTDMQRIKTYALVLLGLFSACQVWAGSYTQTIELQPGWNAIHVEVEPDFNAIEQVFAGIPVASIWRWIPDDRPVTFIQDPDEDFLTVDGWYGYFPPERPESILTNLHTINANQSYLVRLLGSSPRSVEISGQPRLRPMRWRSDGFQLTGFPVVPGNEPTFAAWFAGSEAHEGQSIYRLDDGQWQLVSQPQITRMRSGEAYWVYTRGRSAYQGPLGVELDFGDRLDFGASVARDSVVVRNRSGVSNQIRIRRLDAEVPVPLALATIDEETGDTEWPVIPEHTTFSLPVDESRILRFGVQRASLFANNASQVIEISNGLGSRLLLDVSAAVYQPSSLAQAATSSNARAGTASQRSTDPRFAGLWLGVASIDQVSVAQAGGVVPVPTGSDFPLRMIVHVDAAGNVLLLKEVIQMWQEGTYRPDEENPEFNVVDEPGRYVLITDESLLPQFSGAVLRDGEPVGIRLSTAAYDFEGRELELEGVFGPGGLLTGTIVLDPTHPTNPFLHRFHPDHDNLDPQFLNFRQEAYEVTRQMEFFFATEDPEGFDRPEWGNGEVAGTFTESISGLHRSTIFVSGTFRFRRVLNIDQLNQ